MSQGTQTRKIVTGVFGKIKDAVTGTTKAFTPKPIKAKPYMENTRQREAREAANKAVKEANKEIYARQAVLGTAVGTGTVMKLTGGKDKTVASAPASVDKPTSRQAVAPEAKSTFVPWRERKFPSDLSAKKSEGVAKGITQRSSVSDSPKGIGYKDVRRGRATAMQESKSRFQRAQKAKQAKRIDAEMSKPSARQPAKSVIDFKPNFQASQDYFKSLQKAPTPSPRAEVDTESYKPRPGTRMGIGKYQAKQSTEEVKASTPTPTKKPVRSDYPDTSSYMAAYRAYEQARRASKL
jgi:hypothetical protein